MHKMLKIIFVKSYFVRKNTKMIISQNLSYLMSFNQLFIYFFFLPLFLFYFLQLTSMVCFEHRQVHWKTTKPRKECRHRPNVAVDPLVQAVTTLSYLCTTVPSFSSILFGYWKILRK